MNGLLPQCVQAQIELERLADVKYQIITPQSSAPIISIREDALVSSYNMTAENLTLDWRTAMNILSSTKLQNYSILDKNSTMTGKELFSSIIPKKINMVKGNASKMIISIKNGELLEGQVVDAVIGVKKKNNLIQLVLDEYGVKNAVLLIDNIISLANNFNLYHGMTIGIGDLDISDKLYSHMYQVFQTEKTEVNHQITDFENNPNMIDEELFEKSIKQKLDVIRDDIGKLIFNNFKADNNIKIMNLCGSKGSILNIGQMAGCVGNQDFLGSRMPKNYNQRTLPYFFKNDDSGEARGFIESSLMNGINLSEFIFYHIAGREGLIDQALKSVTPDTKIIIKRNNNLEIVEIGNFVDNLLEKANNITNTNTEEYKNMEICDITEEILIPSIDEDGKSYWLPIEKVTRHNPTNMLFKVKTKSGRTVKVPETKSLLVFNETLNKIYEKNTTEIKINEKLPIINNLIEMAIQDHEYKYLTGQKFEYTTQKEMLINNFRLNTNGIKTVIYENNNSIEIIENNNNFNDVMLDEVIEIKECSNKYSKLYDLTIPQTCNFVLANGLCVRDTASSGYLQRKFIKATEDFMIKYDGTVRNAVERIQQFIYGDSGVDTVKQYDYKFKIMEMNNKEIMDTFKFTQEELKKVKNFTEKDNEKYYKEIIKMRNHLRETQIKATMNYLNLNTNYMFPVNLNRIIDNTKNNDHKESVITDVEYILKSIEHILLPNNCRLYSMTEDEINNAKCPKNIDDKISKLAFRYALYETLAPKKCILTYKLSKEQLDDIVKQIISSFNRSIVEPGEMVGILGAQSLGEPVTQMVLNTFHSTGLGVNAGVPRIQEVFSLSKNLKTPIMVIYLDEEHRHNKDYAKKISSHIKFTTIKDLRTKIDIYYDNNPYEKGGIMEKDNVYNIFYAYQVSKSCCLNKIEGLPWLMRIEFDKEKLMNKEVSLLDIKSKFCVEWEKRYQDIKSLKRDKRHILDKITQLAVLTNSENDNIPIMHIRFDMTNFNSSTLIDFLDIFIDDFKLKGINDIKDIIGVNDSEPKLITFNPEGNIETKTENIIMTNGINMQTIRDIIGVDLTRTYCNDILAVYEMFGIEAARNLIIKEITTVFEGNAVPLNYQHISIFADLMTNVGTLTSIDRHGLNKLDTDPLARASFEKSVEQLIAASVFNEVDHMKSVSSRIMAGLCIKGGTGLCNLVLDKDLLENSEYTIDIGQLYNKTFDDIVPINDKQEIDTDVFIPDF
jgi:DNA-directed RNA polymerase beta' subunit